MNKAIIFAVTTLLVAATLVSAGPPTKAERTQLRVLNCNLNSQSQADCDIEAYGIRVITYAAPGIIYAVITLLICPFYCMGKVCCNCCGGRQQSQGCCCPMKDRYGNQLPMVYSMLDIIRVKFWLCVVTVFIGGAFAWGYFGAAELTGGLTDFGDSISSIPDILTGEINNIDDSLVLNSWNATTNGTSPLRLFSTTGNATKTAALDARDSLKKNIDSTLGDYNSRVDQAKEALWLAFLIPLCIMGVGFFLGVFNCRRVMPMLIVWLLFLFSFVIWAVHGLFAAAFFIFSDVCVEVDAIDNQQANVIAQLAGCQDSSFSGFRTSFKTLEIQQAESVCNSMSTLCYKNTDSLINNMNNGAVFECPDPMDCNGMTFAALVDLMQTSFKIHTLIRTSTLSFANQVRCRDTTVDCTLELCSRDCAVAASEGGYLLSIGLQSAEIYYTFLGAKQISNSIDTLGARFSNCDSAMKIVLGILNAPCKRMVLGLEHEMNASGLLAFAMFTGIFVFAWGAKRFISFHQVGMELWEGEEVKSESDWKKLGPDAEHNEPVDAKE